MAGGRNTLRAARFYDFSGGLNLGRGDFALGKNELRICLNLDLDKRGALTKRRGRKRYNNRQIAGYQDSL